MASGQVVGLIDDLPTCQELVDRIVSQADDVLKDLELSGREAGIPPSSEAGPERPGAGAESGELESAPGGLP
jgi:hypothetical protein